MSFWVIKDRTKLRRIAAPHHIDQNVIKQDIISLFLRTTSYLIINYVTPRRNRTLRHTKPDLPHSSHTPHLTMRQHHTNNTVQRTTHFSTKHAATKPFITDHIFHLAPHHAASQHPTHHRMQRNKTTPQKHSTPTTAQQIMSSEHDTTRTTQRTPTDQKTLTPKPVHAF